MTESYLTRIPQHELRHRGPNVSDGPDTRHKDVMSIFSELGSQPRANAGALFRLERYNDRAPAYLVRSRVVPENAPAGSESVQEDFSLLLAGMTVQFRVSINAIQRTKTGIRPVFPDGTLKRLNKEGQIPQIVAENAVELTPWLSEKLNPGLSELHILNHQREVLRSSRRREPSTKNKVIQVDTVDGVAIISDSKALTRFLTSGVGRAKSYGCGLLTVRAIG